MRRGYQARDLLTEALIDLKASGRCTPCTADPDTSHFWLSELEGERAIAARLWAGCPVLAECSDAAVAGGERFGVWAGIDRTPPVSQP